MIFGVSRVPVSRVESSQRCRVDGLQRESASVAAKSRPETSICQGCNLSKRLGSCRAVEIIFCVPWVSAGRPVPRACPSLFVRRSPLGSCFTGGPLPKSAGRHLVAFPFSHSSSFLKKARQESCNWRARFAGRLRAALDERGAFRRG